MAKINVVGEAVVVTSDIALEDLKTVQKYRPDDLKLKNENGDVVFMVSTTEGSGSITERGATFGRATRDDAGLAQVTALMITEKDLTADEVTDLVLEKLGNPLTKLNQIEETIAQSVEAANEDKLALLSSITIL